MNYTDFLTDRPVTYRDMQLQGRKLGVSTQTFNDCRVPYECTLQLQIRFHK